MSALFRSRRGATAVEYIVMLLLTAMVILAIMRVFGSTIEAKYNDAHEELTGLESDRSKSGGGSGSSGSGSGSKSSQDGQGGDGSDNGSASGAEGGGAGASGGAGSASGDGSAGSGGGGGGEGGKSGVSGPSDTSTGSLYVGGKKKPPKEEEPGFNPIILLAALGLVGLLFFVMSKGKDG